MYRPVVAGLCNFSDLKTMTLDDLFDLHEILDIKEQIEKIQKLKSGNTNG